MAYHRISPASLETHVVEWHTEWSVIHPDEQRLLSFAEIRALLGHNSADAIFFNSKS